MADVKITLPTCIPKSDEAVKRKIVAFGIAHLSPLAFVRLAALKAAKMSPVVGVRVPFSKLSVLSMPFLVITTCLDH